LGRGAKASDGQRGRGIRILRILFPLWGKCPPRPAPPRRGPVGKGKKGVEDRREKGVEEKGDSTLSKFDNTLKITYTLLYKVRIVYIFL